MAKRIHVVLCHNEARKLKTPAMPAFFVDKKTKKCFFIRRRCALVKVRRSGNIVIFDIVGSVSDAELTKESNLNWLLREIEDCYRLRRRQIIVNLERVSRIDSDAIIGLLGIQNSREGLSICFYGMQSPVRHALQTPGYLTALRVYDSQREAIESFNQ